MVSDSGRSSACTNFGMLFRFCRFSPFAEEGFTCLDHSMMSKKKNSRFSGRGASRRGAFRFSRRELREGGLLVSRERWDLRRGASRFSQRVGG